MHKKIFTIGASIALSLSAIAILGAPNSFARTLTCAQGGICRVGDTGPGGGKVFYVAPTTFTEIGAPCGTGCRYLEAAQTSTKVKLHWTDVTAAWSGNTATLIGTTRISIGAGYSNTGAMIVQSGAGNSGAASLAKAYSGPTGKADWFLPSRDELNELYLQRNVVGGFVNGQYWSSSEKISFEAWNQSLTNGFLANYGKSLALYVRPVRAF